jgi:hypothetical protein
VKDGHDFILVAGNDSRPLEEKWGVEARVRRNELEVATLSAREIWS